MPEILVLPSPATRKTYPLHLRIVCALVARLADLQVSMQHAHTARLVRNFPKKYCPVESLVKDVEARQSKLRADYAEQRAALAQNPYRSEYGGLQLMNLHKAEGLKNYNKLMQVQTNPGEQPVFSTITRLEQDFARMRAEVSQLLHDELSNPPVNRGTFGNEAPRKENPNA